MVQFGKEDCLKCKEAEGKEGRVKARPHPARLLFLWRALAVLCVAALFMVLSGCSTKPLPPPPETLLVQEPEPAPEPVVEENTTSVPAEEGEQDTKAFFDVACDAKTRTLSFSLRNPTDWLWLVDPSADPSAYKQLVNREEFVVLLMNDFQLNGRERPVSFGEVLFGPGDSFKENCGGVVALRPGEELSCSFTPIKINVKTALSKGVNELELKGTSHYERVELDCS
ncbi:hypothetical protein D6783_05395 [Candidatus Woesearchaeota archaeon]|nr:MAG: hypothetical protein D6783_05395 [Candidatus Woesearchaeota archaeon]